MGEYTRSQYFSHMHKCLLINAHAEASTSTRALIFDPSLQLHILCMQATKALANLCICIDLPELY